MRLTDFISKTATRPYEEFTLTKGLIERDIWLLLIKLKTYGPGIYEECMGEYVVRWKQLLKDAVHSSALQSPSTAREEKLGAAILEAMSERINQTPKNMTNSGRVSKAKKRPTDAIAWVDSVVEDAISRLTISDTTWNAPSTGALYGAASGATALPPTPMPASTTSVPSGNSARLREASLPPGAVYGPEVRPASYQSAVLEDGEIPDVDMDIGGARAEEDGEVLGEDDMDLSTGDGDLNLGQDPMNIIDKPTSKDSDTDLGKDKAGEDDNGKADAEGQRA